MYARFPGFDSWDGNTATQPPRADELHIINDLPLFGGTVPPTDGPIPGGYYAIETRILDPQDPASPPLHSLRIYDQPGGVIAEVGFWPQVVGSGGGLELGEKAAIASVDVSGVGSVTFVGLHDSKTVAVSESQSVNVSGSESEIGVGGTALGPIQLIILQAGGDFLEADNVSFLVLEDNFPPVASDDLAEVFLGESVTFNWRENDSDADGDSIGLVGFTQPERGRVEMNAVTGLGTYFSDSDPAHLGRYSFEYTISDGRGGTDTAMVFLDVTTNHPPVAESRTVEEPRNIQGPLGGRFAEGPFLWHVANDLDGDRMVATLTQEPLHGSVRFRSLPPDATGRSQLQAHYVPFDPHYGPYDGTAAFNDRFAFRVEDLRADGTPTGARLQRIFGIPAHSALGGAYCQ